MTIRMILISGLVLLLASSAASRDDGKHVASDPGEVPDRAGVPQGLPLDEDAFAWACETTGASAPGIGPARNVPFSPRAPSPPGTGKRLPDLFCGVPPVARELSRQEEDSETEEAPGMERERDSGDI